MLNLNMHDREGLKIVEINGIMDSGSSPEAEKYIREILDQGYKKVILNLEGLEYLSSSGLRVFLVAAKKLWSVDGKLKLCSPNRVVKDILDTSGFSMILEVRDSVEQAVSEFSNP